LLLLISFNCSLTDRVEILSVSFFFLALLLFTRYKIRRGRPTSIRTDRAAEPEVVEG